jgi:coproporphyrinogen III oxidase-like Fe-S oxidoreductase
LNGPRREFEEVLDPDAKARETLVMGLRKTQGLDVSLEVWNRLETNFRALENQGLLIIDGFRVRLSEEALFVSDTVFAELV